MTYENRLMVIAPDADLRDSLAFALEAEGYSVTAREGLEDTFGPQPYDCYILDHQAAREPIDDVYIFCRRAQPLVVLAGRPTPWLSQLACRTVSKPHLGEALLVAVEEALGRRVTPAAH